MSNDELHDRIIDQFSYRGSQADVWRAFDGFLATDRFLNLGYSTWYQPHVLGSSQRRLAAKIGRDLARQLVETEAIPLLDLGCGRGGPAIYLAQTYGFDVTGVDLVPYNVATATDHANRNRIPVEFVIGDAARLPVSTDTWTVCTALDSIVYMPEQARAFEEVSRVVRADGLFAASDLVMQAGADGSARKAVKGFANAWDMAPITTLGEYQRGLETAGFVVDTVRDISPNSTDRFRKWTDLYLYIVDNFGSVVERILDYWNLDEGSITEQVRLAHTALPYLRHVLVYARNRPDSSE